VLNYSLHLSYHWSRNVCCSICITVVS